MEKIMNNEDLIKQLWHSRNPCHDLDQDGNDRFYKTVLMVFEDFIQLTSKNKDERLVISKLLSMASHKFSNHGCNDLPSGFWDGVSDEYKKKLIFDIELEDGQFTKEEIESDIEKFENQSDWILMSYFSKKLI